MTIADLETLQSSDQISSVDKEAVTILLSAINDWPEPLLDVDKFEAIVNTFIGGEVTRKKIKSKRIDYEHDAWKAESLSQINELLDLYGTDFSLKQIINNLKNSCDETL